MRIPATITEAPQRSQDGYRTALVRTEVGRRSLRARIFDGQSWQPYANGDPVWVETGAGGTHIVGRRGQPVSPGDEGNCETHARSGKAVRQVAGGSYSSVSDGTITHKADTVKAVSGDGATDKVMKYTEASAELQSLQAQIDAIVAYLNGAVGYLSTPIASTPTPTGTATTYVSGEMVNGGHLPADGAESSDALEVT